MSDNTGPRPPAPPECNLSAYDIERVALRVVELLKAEPKLLSAPAHACAWCPDEVRDLAACAHNAVVNYGTGREQKKMADLKDAVARYEPAMEAHFKATRPKTAPGGA